MSVDDAAPSDAVQALLAAYDEAIRQARTLPLFVWVPSRPTGWRLPRFTLGCRLFLARHVDRSLNHLEGHFAAREALGQLTPQQEIDRGRCAAYRKSLPLGNVLWPFVALAIAALVVAQELMKFGHDIIAYFATLGKRAGLPDEEVERVNRTLNSLAGALLKPEDLLTSIGRITELGLVALITLFALVVLVGYMVGRPFVPSFRITRQLLGTGGSGGLSVRTTVSNWHVSKSVGIFARERELFEGMGERQPPQMRADLVVLAAPLAFLLLFIIQLSAATSNDIVFCIMFTVWLVLLGGTRAWWLRDAWRGRTGREESPPLLGVTPMGSYVQARPVSETVAWPLVFTFGLDPWFGVPIYVVIAARMWHRLAKTADELRGAAAGAPDRGPHRSHPVLSTLAFLSIIGTPIVVQVHLWRLSALLSQTRRRRYRSISLTLLLIVLITGLVETILFWFTSDVTYYMIPSLISAIAFSTLLGTVQHTQNLLVRHWTTQMPYGQCVPQIVAKESAH